MSRGNRKGWSHNPWVLTTKVEKVQVAVRSPVAECCTQAQSVKFFTQLGGIVLNAEHYLSFSRCVKTDGYDILCGSVGFRLSLQM